MSKQEKPKFIDAKRRGFLQGAAVASGAAATGAVAAATGELDVTDAAPKVQPAANGKGYELTDHVKKYYEKARF